MPVKRRNHEVPKGLLKNWLGSDGVDDGFHYVELSNGDLRFEKGKEAKFAITDYLYVPMRRDGKRDDDLENWFSVDENGLALFSRSAAAGKLQNFTNQKQLNQAVRACIALGSRSAYSMYMATKAVSPLNQTTHEMSVTNALNSIEMKFRMFSTWQFTVLYGLPCPLLINERPFADFTSRHLDVVAMPLSPRSLLIGTPNDEPTESRMQISFAQASPNHHKIVDMVNRFSLEMARQWIVAESRTELADIQLELTPEKVQSRMRTDRIVIYQNQIVNDK